MLAAHGSIFTILAISFERYYAICKPLKAGYKCTRLRATIIICIIWLLSIILTSPILIMAKSSETTYLDGSLVYNCILETDTYWTKMYVFISMFAFFCLPLLVLMLVYCLIGRRLIRENLAMSSSTTTSLAPTTSCEMSVTNSNNGRDSSSSFYNNTTDTNNSQRTMSNKTISSSPFVNAVMSMSIRRKMRPKKASSLKYIICTPATSSSSPLRATLDDKQQHCCNYCSNNLKKQNNDLETTIPNGHLHTNVSNCCCSFNQNEININKMNNNNKRSSWAPVKAESFDVARFNQIKNNLTPAPQPAPKCDNEQDTQLTQIDYEDEVNNNKHVYKDFIAFKQYLANRFITQLMGNLRTKSTKNCELLKVKGKEEEEECHLKACHVVTNDININIDREIKKEKKLNKLVSIDNDCDEDDGATNKPSIMDNLHNNSDNNNTLDYSIASPEVGDRAIGLVSIDTNKKEIFNGDRKNKNKFTERLKFSRSKLYWSKQFSITSNTSTNSVSVPSTTTSMLLNNGDATVEPTWNNSIKTTMTSERVEVSLPVRKRQDNNNSGDVSEKQQVSPKPILHYTSSLKLINCSEEDNNDQLLCSSNGLLSTTKSANLWPASNKKSAHFDIDYLVVSPSANASPLKGKHRSDKRHRLDRGHHQQEEIVNLSSSLSCSTTPTLSLSSASQQHGSASTTPSNFSSKSSSPDSVFETNHNNNNNISSYLHGTNNLNNKTSCMNNKDFLLTEEEEDDAFEEENIDNKAVVVVDKDMENFQKNHHLNDTNIVLKNCDENKQSILEINKKGDNQVEKDTKYLKRIHRRTDRSRSTSSFEQQQQSQHKLNQQQRQQQNFYHHFNLSRLQSSLLHYHGSNRKCSIHNNSTTVQKSCRSCSQPIVCSHFNNQNGQQLTELLVVQDLSKKQQMDSRRQVVVMLAFVVTCFFLLFFPYRVFTIWLILSTEDQVKSLGMETYYNLTYFSRILIYLHSAINPIAYNLISTKFRRAFMSILFCRGPSTRRKFITEHNKLHRGFTTNKKQSLSREDLDQRRSLRHTDRQFTS